MFTILKRHDWYLNISILVLAIASLLIIYSVSAELFWQQLIWFAIGFILIFFVSLVDFRPLVNYRWFIGGVYIFAILLLVATFFLAPTIRQARSWLVLGPIQFQTSEFVKLALIIIFASFFTRSHVGIARLSVVLKSFIYFLIPALLILAQPDLGTVLILFGIWAGFLLVSGLPWKYVLVGFLILAVVGAFGWFYFLQDYQKERIIGLFDTSYDPLGVNYSVIQSKIAIGSAGFWGKGFGQGTQVQLGFLPEAATDFIYAAFIEEWGLLGGIFILAIFTFMLIRIMKIGINAENNFSRFVCLGVVIMFLIQFFINVGSTIGILPVVGVTFPFFSYGGSSILINSILIGIVQGISARSRF